MNKTDKLFGYALFGFIIFIICFCTGWWLGYIFNSNVIVGAITGVVIGIILNIIFLEGIVKNLYTLKYSVLALVYLIYSVGMFGFFMGVPVFNIFLGTLAGYYIGRRMKLNQASKKTFIKETSMVNKYCLGILVLICVSSAYFALASSSTGYDIKGMLNLNFEVTNTMIWGIIIIGGALLIIAQHFLTEKAASITYHSK
jgi:hypothetical protein